MRAHPRQEPNLGRSLPMSMFWIPPLWPLRGGSTGAHVVAPQLSLSPEDAWRPGLQGSVSCQPRPSHGTNLVLHNCPGGHPRDSEVPALHLLWALSFHGSSLWHHCAGLGTEMRAHAWHQEATGQGKRNTHHPLSHQSCVDQALAALSGTSQLSAS